MKYTAVKKLCIGVAAVWITGLILGLSSLPTIRTLGGSLDSAVNGTAKKLSLVKESQQNVDAARAGGTGMGFAVVADEVRSLAQRATSSREPRRHVGEMRQVVNRPPTMIVGG